MSVDLHRISTGISSGSSRNGFGNIVSFPSVSFPANGSYNSTLNDVEYPIAEGGASVTVASVAYPSQTCDVDVENDGAGGTYTDWTTATDVQYKPYGSSLYTDTTPFPLEVEVPSGSGNNYQGGTCQTGYYHDGAGSSYNEGVNPSYYSDGTNTNLTGLNEAVAVEVPSGGSYYADGTYTGYTWNGSGGYNYPVSGGAYYANNTEIFTSNNQTEVPSGSMDYYDNGTTTIYKWNGSGGYTQTGGGAFYDEDVYITDDGTTGYYWSDDGTGGYYSQAL